MARKKAASVATCVMILVPNVWADETKWFLHDVVELTDATLLVDNKQAKVTRDDPTHTRDGDGNRCEI